uniref:Uncharacterized protein n=1 Tax=Parascaris univalens TaxID=6257 RepID=A0A915BQA8_PARUN
FWISEKLDSRHKNIVETSSTKSPTLLKTTVPGIMVHREY